MASRKGKLYAHNVAFIFLSTESLNGKFSAPLIYYVFRID